MNVPKLRFKEFNDEYKAYKFNDVAKLYRGGSPRPIVNFITKSEDSVNWIKIGDVSPNETYIKSTSEKITKEGAKKSRKVYKGEIILSNSMSFGRPYILNLDGCIHDGWFVVRDYEKLLNKEYLYHFMSSPLIQKQYKTLSAGGVVSNISSELVYSVKLNIPLKEEQLKVANFLSLLDKKIELQSKKIEDLKLFKKGLNKFIFSNCTDEYKVENLIIEYNDKTTENNQYKVLSSTANGIIFQNEYFNKRAASNNNTGYKIIPKGLITYRSMSDTGEFHFNIQDITDIGIVSPAYPVFNIKKNLVNKTYFVYYINENGSFKNKILSTKEGGTRYALSITKFKTIYILLPKMEEQIKYSKYINVIINKIQIEEKKLEKLVQFKKGLMQNMFV